MSPRKPGPVKPHTVDEAPDTIPAPDEDEISVYLSGSDSGDSGNEVDFVEGIDSWSDVVDEEEEEGSDDSWSALEEEKGKSRRSRPPANRGKRSRSETFSGDALAWKSEKEPDSIPNPPLRFLPKRSPGIQPPLSEYVNKPSAAELFKMYFDRAAIRTLCANTNKNAAKNIAAGKKLKWTELTEVELYQYIGLTLYMGILKLPKVKDFWRANSIFRVPYPAKVMPRDRFFAITWNLHMSDPADDALNDSKKGTADYDCLHRLRPLYDNLRAACKAMYQPQQQISVDERMVATKARISLKQYIKKKPKKWGIKFFVLSDNSGYTVDFNIYTPRSSLLTGRGLSFDAVMSLVNKNYLGSGYHVYCDNFYTSPALFSHLYGLGFGACGTFQDKRAGVPKTTVNALTKKSPPGSIRWIREGPLIFIKWLNIREVNMCSTLHTASAEGTAKSTRKVDGKYTTVEVPLPSAVKDYNRFMGGVDLSDQLIGSYSSWRKSRKWYLTVLHHFIDIAVTNSYLFKKELCGKLKLQPMTHQAFQEELTAELCGVPLRQVPESYEHVPVAIFESASGSKKATQGRRKCRLCGKCTPFMCEACQLPLCVIVDRNCHKAHHSSSAVGS